jgi:hypothetical protein
MARQNGIETRRLQLTVDDATDRIITEMVALGIHGANKAEVATSIIRSWIWDNQERLRTNGIPLTNDPKR